MMINKIKIAIISVFIVVTCYMLHVTLVSAQSPLSITVFPAIINLDVKPGERARFLLQFRNGSELPIAGTIKVTDFTVKDKEGTPILLEDESEKPAYAASKWIKTDTTRMTIPANDFVAVYFNADVPPIVKTCGNYAVVYFESEATAPLGVSQTTKSSSSVITKVGALINFSVQEKTCVEKARVISFRSPKLIEYGPVKLNLEILNEGDIHLQPAGKVQLINPLGQITDEQNIKSQRIFPGTVKVYENSLGPRLMLGRYKLLFSAKYGQANKNLTSVAYVWIFPWKLILVITLAIIILFYALKKVYRDVIGKEKTLEKEIVEEKEEIEKLKEELKKRE